MSVLPGGRVVCCDGNGCCATAPLPVALRPTLGEISRTTVPSSIEGWLFAEAQGRSRHFCPRCGYLYLPRELGDEINLPAEKFRAELGDAR